LDSVDDVLLDGEPMRVFTLDTGNVVYDDREPTDDD
jgi:hypothetical protein